MIGSKRLVASAAVLATLAGTAGWSAEPAGRVTVLETPGGGIQPQAAIDPEGAIHLIYFQGEPGGGDVFYARAEPGQTGFSEPVRVNSQPGSAIATGTIRGARSPWAGAAGSTSPGTARGRPGPRTRSGARPCSTRGRTPADRVRAPAQPDADDLPASTAAARSRPTARGTSTSPGTAGPRPPRRGRKGGGSSWPGRRTTARRSPPRSPPWPRDRRLRLLRDAGLADSRGNVYFLYRAATDNVGRDMTLLTSRDGGGHFEGTTLHPWRLFACPMSSESLAEGARASRRPGRRTGRSTSAGSTRRRSNPRGPSPRPAAATASTRPWPSTRGARRSWPGPRGPAGSAAARSPGRSSTRPGGRPASPGGSRRESRSGACRPSSPGPTAGSRSFTEPHRP